MEYSVEVQNIYVFSERTNTNLFKIVMPTHVGSFRLASRSKEQLSVEIGEPLFIDMNKVDIRDDW